MSLRERVWCGGKVGMKGRDTLWDLVERKTGGGLAFGVLRVSLWVSIAFTVGMFAFGVGAVVEASGSNNERCPDGVVDTLYASGGCALVFAVLSTIVISAFCSHARSGSGSDNSYLNCGFLITLGSAGSSSALLALGCAIAFSITLATYRSDLEGDVCSSSAVVLFRLGVILWWLSLPVLAAFVFLVLAFL